MIKNSLTSATITFDVVGRQLRTIISPKVDIIVVDSLVNVERSTLVLNLRVSAVVVNLQVGRVTEKCLNIVVEGQTSCGLNVSSITTKKLSRIKTIQSISINISSEAPLPENDVAVIIPVVLILTSEAFHRHL